MRITLKMTCQEGFSKYYKGQRKKAQKAGPIYGYGPLYVST